MLSVIKQHSQQRFEIVKLNFTRTTLWKRRKIKHQNIPWRIIFIHIVSLNQPCLLVSLELWTDASTCFFSSLRYNQGLLPCWIFYQLFLYAAVLYMCAPIISLSPAQTTLLASWHVEPATAASTRVSTWSPWWSPTATTPCRAAPAPLQWGCAPATVKATWSCVTPRPWAAPRASAPERSSPSSCAPSYCWVSTGNRARHAPQGGRGNVSGGVSGMLCYCRDPTLSSWNRSTPQVWRCSLQREFLSYTHLTYIHIYCF